MEPIVLPPGVSVGILAFLLALLPAGLFLWLWYLRHQHRPIPTSAVVIAFLTGMGIVIPAFQLERFAPALWERISPSTVHYYDGAILPLQSIGDALLPAVGTFLIVALVEEGLRYLVLIWWFQRSKAVDQVFDGLLIGLAAGLGFATLENTLYFFELFSAGNFDTLVFVFFLRFFVSTLAHISFGGIMGALLARGVFAIYRPGIFYLQAFAIPWFLHGLYDWLLSVNQTMYAVLMLLPPLLVLILWSDRRDFFVINREGRDLIVEQKAPTVEAGGAAGAQPKQNPAPWNKYAPWLAGHTRHRSPMKPKPNDQ